MDEHKEVFERLKEYCSRSNRWESPTAHPEAIYVSWWDGSAQFPIEGFYLRDVIATPNPELENTIWETNVVWCGQHCFKGDEAKALRFLGTLKEEQ